MSITSSSMATWTRSLHTHTQIIQEQEARNTHWVSQPSRQVPVERGDETPGVAFLLEQPVDSSSFTVLTSSDDQRLQHVHLEHGYDQLSCC